MVSRATITTDIWDAIRAILIADSSISSSVGSANIHSAWPQQIYDGSTYKLPKIVINKPQITEKKLTLQKKLYEVDIIIEILANKAADAKSVEDDVRDALESAEATTRWTHFMFNFKITDNTNRIEQRNEKRIHVASLRCSYVFTGGGAN